MTNDAARRYAAAGDSTPGSQQGHPQVGRVLLACAAASLALAVAAPPAFSQADEHAHHRMAMTATPTSNPARVMEVQPQIGDIALVDQDGATVSLREAVAGNVPVLVNFIFTSCTTICPVMSAGFAKLDAQLGASRQAVRLVSISIDPEVDSPSRLREYAASVGAGKSWRFLTGTPAAAETAQRAFGAFRGAKESHSAATYIRRTADGPWERIDGLASGDALMRAYSAGQAGSGDMQR